MSKGPGAVDLGRPLRIGVSACFFHADPLRAIFKGKTLQYLEQSMAHWTASLRGELGAMVYLIPAPAAGAAIQIEHYAKDLDGLVLEGGSDLAPRSYGETPLKPEWGGDYIRDVYETQLLKAFMAEKKPVFGVCRGAQLINVALGGTLYQDIQLQRPEALVHRNWDTYDQNQHDVVFEAGSEMAKVFGGVTKAPTTARVNSVHHQAVKDLAPGLVVDARCPDDGIVEAFTLKSDTYVAAVQWHPEFHDSRNPDFLDCAPLLKHFLERARSRALK